MESFTYNKERRSFGRQCIFSCRNELMFSLTPNVQLYQDNYVELNPFSRSTQLSKEFALSEIVTDNVTTTQKMVLHVEGGWPKDVNMNDEEVTTRYRKKVMREDNWAAKMPPLCNAMEATVKQNSAINIYSQYFEDLEPIPCPMEFSGKTVTMFKDQFENMRPILHISWSYGKEAHMAAVYCSPEFAPDPSHSSSAFIWDIENPNTPIISLLPPDPMLCLEYNPNDPSVLAGSFYAGQVAIFDARTGGKPVLTARRGVSHRKRANSLKWTVSPTDTEFFSGATDGSIYFWDTRSISKPVGELLMDPVITDDQKRSRAHGVCILEYVRSLPDLFLAGNEQGYIFSCNRHGTRPTERIDYIFQAHSSCVNSLVRNPAFPRNYLSVGDFAAKIWSDDERGNATIWTKNSEKPYYAGTWSFARPSIFYVIRSDGVMEGWDLLVQQDEPILKIKVNDDPLYTIRGHQQGHLFAVGGASGIIYLVKVSEDMTTINETETAALSNLYERETKRERYYQEIMNQLIANENRESTKSKSIKSRKSVESKSLVETIVDESELGEDDDEEGARKIPHWVGASLDQTKAEFQSDVDRERDRRDQLIVIPVKTPFDPDFDYTTIFNATVIQKKYDDKLKDIKAKVVQGLLEQHRKLKKETDYAE